MRTWIVTGLVLAMLTTAFVPVAVNASDSQVDRNVAWVMGQLRAEAARNNAEIPDLAGYTAEGVAVDASGESGISIPAESAIRNVVAMFGDVDLASLAPQSDIVGVPGVPTIGVGDNVHVYLGLRFGNCSPRSDYTVKFRAPPPVPVLPGTFVPGTGVHVWGGNTQHVIGSGWLIGIHGFVGAPIDVNVHTGGSPPVSPFLAVGLDSSIDTLGVSQFSTVSIPIRFFGFCILSIDLGSLGMNGAMEINGALLPPQLPLPI